MPKTFDEFIAEQVASNPELAAQAAIAKAILDASKGQKVSVVTAGIAAAIVTINRHKLSNIPLFWESLANKVEKMAGQVQPHNDMLKFVRMLESMIESLKEDEPDESQKRKV